MFSNLPFWMIRIVDVQGLMAGKSKLVSSCYTVHVHVLLTWNKKVNTDNFRKLDGCGTMFS